MGDSGRGDPWDRKRLECGSGEEAVGSGGLDSELSASSKRMKLNSEGCHFSASLESNLGPLPDVKPSVRSPLEDFTALSLLPSSAETSSQVPSMAGKLQGISRPSDADRVGTHGQIRKVEFIRLIEQALYSMGYNRAAEELERESNVPLETGAVAALRSAVMDGQWDESSRILHSLGDVTPEAMRQAEFLVQQQKFLEFLEASDMESALSQLRLHLGPICVDRRRLHQLASLLMCTTREDLLSRSGWQGSGYASRCLLMGDIQALLPPTLMVPERRLERIVEQTLRRQEEECLYHNYGSDSLCLFADHDCGRSQIPSVTTQVLEEHTDEVWYVQFSHDGTRLASASKDARSIIWEISDDFHSRVQHVLEGHSQPLSFVAWSPDDSMLVTCGSDHLVKLWSTRTGTCLHTYRRHTVPVTACAWFPCGRRFVSVAPTKGGHGSHGERSLYVWDTDGNEVPQAHMGDPGGAHEVPQHLMGGRINDVAVSADGKLMVTICSDQKIAVHNLESGAVHTVAEARSVTSLSLSLDSRYALVNVSDGCIHLWDLGAMCRKLEPQEQPCFQYKGQVQGRFVIRSCFGGSHQSYIVSGSEDSQVYMWHRPTGEILHVLPGHAGTVNAVSWPASRPLMFASASDDGTIRIWGLKDLKPPTASRSKGTHANGLSVNGFKHFKH